MWQRQLRYAGALEGLVCDQSDLQFQMFIWTTQCSFKRRSKLPARDAEECSEKHIAAIDREAHLREMWMGSTPITITIVCGARLFWRTMRQSLYTAIDIGNASNHLPLFQTYGVPFNEFATIKLSSPV